METKLMEGRVVEKRVAKKRAIIEEVIYRINTEIISTQVTGVVTKRDNELLNKFLLEIICRLSHLKTVNIYFDDLHVPNCIRGNDDAVRYNIRMFCVEACVNNGLSGIDVLRQIINDEDEDCFSRS